MVTRIHTATNTAGKPSAVRCQAWPLTEEGPPERDERRGAGEHWLAIHPGTAVAAATVGRLVTGTFR
jgi:hypothetical protein